MRLILKLAGAVLLFCALVVGGMLLLPAERLAMVLSDRLTRQLDRPVAVTSARLSIWPEIGLSAEGVRIAGPAGTGDTPLLQADSVAFGLDPVAALRGRIAVRRVLAEAPVLYLETTGADAADPGDAPGAGGGLDLPAMSLDVLRIRNGRLIFVAPGGRRELRNADVTLRWPAPGEPLRADLALVGEGPRLTAALSVADPRALAAGRMSGVDVTVDLPGGTLGFAGQAGPLPVAEGALRVDVADYAALAGALSAFGLDLPDGLARRIAGTARVSLAQGPRLALRQGMLDLDGARAQIDADLDLAGNVPDLSAQVRAGVLSLPGGTGGTRPAESGRAGWSTAPIDAAALGAVNGTVDFAIEGLRHGDIALGPARGTLSIADRRAVLDLDALEAFGGRVTGQAVANNRNGFSARLTLALRDIALQSLLDSTLGTDRIEGQGNLDISLLGVGGSVDALMRSLSGDGRLSAGPGVINGIDLAAALGGDATGGTTIFTTAAATMQVAQGVLRNSDLAMDLPLAEARGAGEVDLGNRRIDYVFSVGDPGARGGRGLVLPVRLSGPWADIRVAVDAQRLLEQNLAEERAQIERRAEEALQRELGLRPREGQSPEDAIREELENRALQGLRNLFDR